MVNEVLAGLCLEKHPDKTFIGKIERGFDFLGYHFSPAGLTVARQTIARFVGNGVPALRAKAEDGFSPPPLEMGGGPAVSAGQSVFGS